MEEDPLIAQCQGRVGRLINGKWRLDALIGVGGMAAVYMATHRNGSVAAIKILHDEVSLNEEVRTRFLREAYIANKVDHPGTVKVLDDDVDESATPYLVMELLQGTSVEGMAEKAGGCLTVDQTLRIIDDVLAVLEAAHEKKIIHRDLKPENLFMTQKGDLKVLDFGIARLREDNAKKTQTGMVMGTPSFMAPEQAMGRWNEVDHRTDLYAVGATAFTLLTGRPVHEAETAGEMLVAAATRPARSLARVLNNAPFSLVALVDKALAYQRDQRFANATAFRKELARVGQDLDGQTVTPVEAKPSAPLIPATVLGEEPADEYERAELREQIETFDPSTNSPEEIERMQNIFVLLERALVATKQYAPDHPEPKRRMADCFKEVASALMTCDLCLAWNFTPYAFVAGDVSVWEPEPPWNRIPYQLFSDGVRTMGLVPGLDEVEFQKWVSLITLDPTQDLAPEDDLVTKLWDADFRHVFHQAIDSFSDGNQEQRARFEAEKKAVIDNAQSEPGKDIAQAWRKGQAEGGAKARADSASASRRAHEILGYVNRGSPIDAEAAARVMNLDLQESSPEEAAAARSLELDDATRALLAARLDVDVSATSERFVFAATAAFMAAARTGRSQAVTGPLRRAVDGMASAQPHKAIAMVIELREAVDVEDKPLETENLRNTLTAEVVSPETFSEILRGSDTAEHDRQARYLDHLSKLIEAAQGQHLDTVIAFMPHTKAGKLRAMLLDFLRRTGQGHEPKIGALFTEADLELGLELVRLLVEFDTPEAKEAASMAANSPHALVRIEALGHLEGVSGTRVRAEMRKLLEDDQLPVRLAALRAMAEHKIAAAGPFLVLRIQDKAFLKLPDAERRASLDTLRELRPQRAEEICTALLSQASWLRSGALESTREMAVGVLAQVASSKESFYLLDEISRSKPWRNSKRVRDAASAALSYLAERAEQQAKAAAAAPRQATRRKKKGASKSGTTGAGKRSVSKKKRPSQAGSSTPGASRTPSTRRSVGSGTR